MGKKDTTISVRMASELSEKFENVRSLLEINKADFLRSCVKKLCKDNRLLLDHQAKISDYATYIKDELCKLKNIKIENGVWNTVASISIYVLCDELWSTSEKVFDCWKEIIEGYTLHYWDETKEEYITDFSQAEDGMLEFADYGLLMAEKSRIEIDDLLEDDLWYDLLEMKKATLLLSVKRAIEKHSAETIIGDYLNVTSKYEGIAKKILVIDASGKFRRSGNTLITPVRAE